MKFNKQEIFDKVYDHLHTQGRKSVIYEHRDKQINCRYRAPNGDKCAIGCLIPDELYTPSIEGNNVQSFNVKKILYQLYPEMTSNDLLFLIHLQEAHDVIDGSNFISYLNDVMEDIALYWILRFREKCT